MLIIALLFTYESHEHKKTEKNVSQPSMSYDLSFVLCRNRDAARATDVADLKAKRRIDSEW